MTSMMKAIEPKSDQINADDLIGGDMVITITNVRVTDGEQPVEISFEGSKKFYRPCKSMARVLVSAWGADPSVYVGRSLKLYRDQNVTWGGMKVGGIRISEMSDLGDRPVTFALTAKRGQRTPTIIRPLSTPLAAAQAAASRGTIYFREWWTSQEGKGARAAATLPIDALKALAEAADARPVDPDPEPDSPVMPSLEDRLRAEAEARAAAAAQEQEFTRDADPIEDAEVVSAEREPGEE